MTRSPVRIVGGILLVVVGILTLLQGLGALDNIAPIFWAIIFCIGGILLLYIFLANRVHWWAIIPGFLLLSVAALLVVEEFAPDLGGDWEGVLVLGGIGAAFWVIYFMKREQWWAIIPGGVMVTLALVTGLSSTLDSDVAGGVFFLGLGLTFGLMAFLPSSEGRMKWAPIPGAILLIIGAVIMSASTEVFKYLWPAALILVGIYLIVRVFGRG